MGTAMHRQSIDRLTDTVAFEVLLALLGLPALLVLLLGLLVTFAGAVWWLVSGFTALDGGAVAIAALSVGGATGLVGWLRARRACSNPAAYNLTAIVLCLLVGTLTVLAVAGGVVGVVLIESWFVDRNDALRFAWVLAFVLGNLVWALCGIGWMQRLAFRYRERTGLPFDSGAVALLFIALASATAVMLIAATL